MVNLSKTLFFILITFLYACNPNEQNTKLNYSNLQGPYLGQTLPGDIPQLFAPGLISTELYTRDITFMPDGKEIYFCVSALGFNLIYFTKQVDGHWIEPQPASFISDYSKMYYEPHITTDGKQLLFLSNMEIVEGEKASEDIWAVDRQGDGWSKPYNLGSPVNTDANEFYPSTTKDGTLYFTRQEKGSQIHKIFRSKHINGSYTEPEELGQQVNCGKNRFNAFVDPDERFLIVPAAGMENTVGATDYYIVFRDENDNWSEPLNLGAKINTKNGREYSASLSPDGKYFFFMSTRTPEYNFSEKNKLSLNLLRKLFVQPENGNSNIYWVKSDFLMQLKN